MPAFLTPALINSSIAVGPNSGAMRFKLIDASVAALMSFALRAVESFSNSVP